MNRLQLYTLGLKLQRLRLAVERAIVVSARTGNPLPPDFAMTVAEARAVARSVGAALTAAQARRSFLARYPRG